MEHSHIHNDNCKVKARLANVSPVGVCDVDSIIVGSLGISRCRVTSQACSDIAVSPSQYRHNRGSIAPAPN